MGYLLGGEFQTEFAAHGLDCMAERESLELGFHLGPVFGGCRVAVVTPSHLAAAARSRKVRTSIRDPCMSSSYIRAIVRLITRTA